MLELKNLTTGFKLENEKWIHRLDIWCTFAYVEDGILFILKFISVLKGMISYYIHKPLKIIEWLFGKCISGFDCIITYEIIHNNLVLCRKVYYCIPETKPISI